MGTVIGMLKSIVTFTIFMVVAYVGAILVIKKRITDKRQFRTYKDLLALGVIAVIGLFVYWRSTHT